MVCSSSIHVRHEPTSNICKKEENANIKQDHASTSKLCRNHHSVNTPNMNEIHTHARAHAHMHAHAHAHTHTHTHASFHCKIEQHNILALTIQIVYMQYTAMCAKCVLVGVPDRPNSREKTRAGWIWNRKRSCWRTGHNEPQLKECHQRINRYHRRSQWRTGGRSRPAIVSGAPSQLVGMKMGISALPCINKSSKRIEEDQATLNHDTLRHQAIH